MFVRIVVFCCRALLWAPFVLYGIAALVAAASWAYGYHVRHEPFSVLPFLMLSSPWWLPFRNNPDALGDAKILIMVAGVLLNGGLLFALGRAGRRIGPP